MNRWVASAAVGTGAFIVLAGVAVGGYELHQPATVTRTVTKTVTRTVPKVVTVTRTAPPRVITRTVSGTPSIPCTDDGADAVDPGVLVPGVTQGATTCQVAVASPAGASHLGEVTLTAPSGDASTFTMTRTG